MPLSSHSFAAVPAVEIAGLDFAYAKGDPVLRNINLHMAHGDFMAVLGPNGGGKTTLLKLILGLLTPDAGRVEVYGRRPAQMRGNIGYVPQATTVNLDFPACALEVVLMGAAAFSVFYGAAWPSRRQQREYAAFLLESVGLAGVEKLPMRSLSGGQKQRVLVARALMSRPAPGKPYLLILDEPTASIDQQGKFCFYEFLVSMQGCISIMVVSHDLTMASGMFKSIAVVNRTLTLIDDPAHAAETLGAFFGEHQHECPMNMLMQAAGKHGASKVASSVILTEAFAGHRQHEDAEKPLVVERGKEG